jgi:hypothetical protein
MRWIAFLIAGILAAIGPSPQPTLSQSWITVTQCDSVRLNGHLYPRVTFDVTNQNDRLVACYIYLQPRESGLPTDTCSAIQCTPPEGWFCDVSPVYGSPFWGVTAQETCILPGETESGFRLVLGRSHCCFDLFVTNVIPEPFAHEVVCFECVLPVPARALTWGQIKTIYRD